VDKVLDGNLEQMEAAITRLKNRLSVSKNSYGFFFYAGHGVQSGGVNYLIPVGASISSENYLRDRAVSVQTMLGELNDAGNALNIVVLDACRDNPFSWARSGSRGLTVVSNQPVDSIVVYATSAGSTAADGTGRNGLFTSHLLNHLKTPGLEVKEVFNRTGSDVARASNRTQVPAVYNQFFETAYLGTRPESTPAIQPAVVPQPAPVPTVVLPPTPAPQPAALDRDFVMNGTVLSKYRGNVANVVIPAGVTSIGKSAFQSCAGISAITIPASVTSIGDSAFQNCTGLSAITIPAGATSIGRSAFQNCSGLRSITIPASVTSIGDSAFRNCTGLSAVTILEGVTSIGRSAFQNSTALRNVTIPASVASIGNNAFHNCTSLSGITIAEGVASIGKQTFVNCTALTSITIPASVTSIGEEAFYGWRSAQTINVQGKANRAAADAAWGKDWREDCKAKISYLK